MTIKLNLAEYVEKNAWKAGFSPVNVKIKREKRTYSNPHSSVAEINGRKVFLKVIDDPLINEAGIAKREALLMKFFSGICPEIYLVDKCSGKPVIWMEYLEGPSLEEINHKDSDLKKVVEILATIHNTPLKKVNTILKKTSSKIIGAPLPECKLLVKKYGNEPIFRKAVKMIELGEEYLRKNSMKFEKTLIHGDAGLKNFVKTKKGVKVIDWENSHIDDPAKDFTNLFWMADYWKTGLTDKQKNMMLDHYSKFRKDDAIRQRMEVYYSLDWIYASIWEVRDLYKDKKADKKLNTGNAEKWIDKSIKKINSDY